MRDLAHHPDALRRIQLLAEEAGLTPSIAKALAHLTPGRPTPMRELGGALRCDNSYVTTVVDTLERRELVRRLPHPTDRRIKVVELTPAGAEIARRLHAALDEPPPGFAELDAAQAAELLRLLRTVCPTDLPTA